MKVERFVFVLLAIASLLLGMWTGLTRLGWDIHHLNATAHHGAIMVGGFLGTLISLEKAIPLQKKISLVIPVISASSIVFFLSGDFSYSLLALILASIGLCIIYGVYLIRQYDLTLLLMFLGALFWMVGNILLLTRNFYPLAFPWWMAFLLFTIVGERLELSKFLPVTKINKNVLMSFLGIFLMGVLLPFHSYGAYFSGISLILISAWLIRFDVVRITIKKKGLTRFTGIRIVVRVCCSDLRWNFPARLSEYSFRLRCHPSHVLYWFYLLHDFCTWTDHLSGCIGIIGKTFSPGFICTPYSFNLFTGYESRI